MPFDFALARSSASASAFSFASSCVRRSLRSTVREEASADMAATRAARSSAALEDDWVCRGGGGVMRERFWGASWRGGVLLRLRRLFLSSAFATCRLLWPSSDSSDLGQVRTLSSCRLMSRSLS